MTGKAKRGRPEFRIHPTRIAALRGERGWTQHRLARESGLGVSAVQAHERHERSVSPEAAARYARALGVHVLDLFELQ